MNITLWVLQGLLALLCLAGGAFKAINPAEVAKQASALPLPAWRAVGVFEVLGALLLVVPGATGFSPELTHVGAAAIAVESLILAALYARVSTRLTAANPLVFVLPMGLMAVAVAYGRSALAPFHAG